MGRRNRAALLPTHLPQLQNLIKRDPKSYESEFLQQYRHYQSTLSIFCSKPDEEAKELCELVTFISQVTQCYPKQTEEFPQQLVDLLQQHCIALHPEVRRTFVTALILLRNKKILDNTRYVWIYRHFGGKESSSPSLLDFCHCSLHCSSAETNLFENSCTATSLQI